jgi:hypothetical protein
MISEKKDLPFAETPSKRKTPQQQCMLSISSSPTFSWYTENAGKRRFAAYTKGRGI